MRWALTRLDGTCSTDLYHPATIGPVIRARLMAGLDSSTVHVHVAHLLPPRNMWQRHTSYSPQQHARDQLQIVTCANKCTKRKRKTTGALIRPPMAARQRLLCVGSVVLSVRWRVAGAASAEGGADELESNRIKSKQVRCAAVPGPRVDPVNCFLGSKGCFLGSKEKHSAATCFERQFCFLGSLFRFVHLLAHVTIWS